MVDALGGGPGVRSARYAGEAADDRANVAKLLDALRSVPEGDRGARFYCVLVALDSADDPAPADRRRRVARPDRGAAARHREASATTRYSSIRRLGRRPPSSARPPRIA